MNRKTIKAMLLMAAVAVTGTSASAATRTQSCWTPVNANGVRIKMQCEPRARRYYRCNRAKIMGRHAWLARSLCGRRNGSKGNRTCLRRIARQKRQSLKVAYRMYKAKLKVCRSRKHNKKKNFYLPDRPRLPGIKGRVPVLPGKVSIMQ